MTLLKIVKELQEQGHALNYRLRKDGSVVITRIDGVSYRDKSGNAKARSMVGSTLTEAKIAQLAKIRTPKGKFGHRKKTETVDDPLKKMLRKVQAEFRKHGVKDGKPTIKNLRYTVKHYGREEAIRKLEQASRYARGIAYPENVIALGERITEDGQKMDIVYADDLINLGNWLIRVAYDDRITESKIKEALEILYDMEEAYNNQIEEYANEYAGALIGLFR